MPDLLTVSFSSNDLIGHTWGPDSHEVLDVTLRADKVVADLLGFLDTEVGKGRYAVVMTADHGICPIPEQKRIATAARLSVYDLLPQLPAALDETFGPPPSGLTRWLELDGKDAQAVWPWVYLNHAVIRARKLDPEAVEAQFVGRHKDGRVLGLEGEPPGHNDFRYRDPAHPVAVRPSAHIRRANPRDALIAASAMVPRHQLFRRGYRYGPLDRGGKPVPGAEQGIVFMACCADLERQFGEANLVNNGGFETGTFAGWSQFGDTSNSGISTTAPNSGVYKALFNPMLEGGIEQVLPTVPGTTYDVEFWLRIDGTPGSTSSPSAR